MPGKRKSRTPVRVRASERGALAAVVAARRDELDLRQAELAELAGCSTQFVHDLEAGKETVQLNKLLDVLGVLGLRLQLEQGAGVGAVTVSGSLSSIYSLDPLDSRATGLS